MEISEVKSHIKTGNFDNLYIFAGDEHYVLREYIHRIAKVSDSRVEYVDSVSEVLNRLSAKSLVLDPVVYVVVDDKEFLSSDSEKVWNAMDIKCRNNILVCQYTKVDKRIKFWKHWKDRAVFFEHLPTRLIQKYIQRRIKLSDENCEKLAEICENDLGRVLLEVDKIAIYSGEDCNKVFSRMIDSGAIYVPPKDAIFDFVAAVLERNDKPKIYDLLNQSYAVGEPNMVLLSVLYNNLEALLQVQSCEGSQLSKSTGLTGFQIKNVKPYIDNWDEQEIIDALQLLRKCERGIKTGTIRDEVTVLYVLANILE